MSKLSDKLTKINDNLTVNFYDNGFMIEVSGRNSSEDWATAKILCTTLEEVNALIAEASTMEKD